MTARWCQRSRRLRTSPATPPSDPRPPPPPPHPWQSASHTRSRKCNSLLFCPGGPSRKYWQLRMVNVLCKVLFQPSHLSTDSTKDVSGQHNSFLFHQFLNRNWQFPLSRRHCARRGDVLQLGKLTIILSSSLQGDSGREQPVPGAELHGQWRPGRHRRGRGPHRWDQQQHAAHYWGSEYSEYKYKCNIFCC